MMSDGFGESFVLLLPFLGQSHETDFGGGAAPQAGVN
jgi:hypothetical protein